MHGRELWSVGGDEPPSRRHSVRWYAAAGAGRRGDRAPEDSERARRTGDTGEQQQTHPLTCSMSIQAPSGRRASAYNQGVKEMRSANVSRQGRRGFFLAALVTFTTLTLLGDQVVTTNESSIRPEVRRHCYVVGHGGDVFYELTEIVRASEVRDETILLVRDMGNADFLYLRLRVRGTEQTVTGRLSSVDGRTFVEMSNTMPLTDKEALPNARQSDAMHTAKVARLESNGGSWNVLDEELRKDAEYRRHLTYDMRRGVNATLVEALERMRTTLFQTPSGWPLHSDIGQYILYGATKLKSLGESDGMTVQVAPPDCGFDHAFGYDCTDAQRERVHKANETGRQLETY